MKHKDLSGRFRELEPRLRRLDEEAVFILTNAIRPSEIRIHSITSRVKSLQSFVAKIERKGLENLFEEVEDFVGLRVICLLRSDIERLGHIIRNEFDVIKEDNKIDGSTVDVFGYQSVHFVSRIKPSHSGPRYDGLHELCLEIQVRTLAMHAWATLSHYLDYKTEPDVPRDLRKDFFALSGLFYVADTHFELFYEARQRAGSAAREAARMSPTTDRELDLDSLTAYLARRYSDRERAPAVDVSELVSELTTIGYTTIGQLHAVLDKAAKAFAAYEREAPPLPGPRFSDVGVVRISLAIADPKYFELKAYKNPLIVKYQSQLAAEFKR